MTNQENNNTVTAPAGGARLHRTLGLWNLIIIGMVIVQPTAPMGIYGVISNKAHGHVVTTILLATAVWRGSIPAPDQPIHM
jgi:hypothetical protein